MDLKKINLQDLQLQYSVDINSFTGNAVASIPVPVSKGRNGLEPSLSLNYNSSSQNSIFGMGWSLGGSTFISIDTKNGLPKYDGTDLYAFNGSTQMVPQLVKVGINWEPRIDENPDYFIYYYRAKLEDAYIRFEKWVKKSNGKIHWRTRTKGNILSVYGLDDGGKTQIRSTENVDKVCMWLLEAQYDDTGNCIQYIYKEENADQVDDAVSYEHGRLRKFKKSGFAQKYLTGIRYGNSEPILVDTAVPLTNTWLFEIVFDFGEYENRPYTHSQPLPGASWSCRLDPFSVYNPGFEIRTYRLCRRILMYHHFDELAPTSLKGIFECTYQERETGTTLTKINYTGIRRDLITGAYSEKKLPELSFRYTQPTLGNSFQAITKETTENLPQGFNHHQTRMVDLLGEGIPGILTETINTWYYKPNLGNGEFGKQEIVIAKPSQQIGVYALGDFDNDGNLNLFTLQGRMAGYFEYNRDREEWSGFLPFEKTPQVGNIKFMDINSDGFMDMMLECDDKIICYPFKGKEGFGEPVEFAKPISNGVEYAPTLGDNLHLDYFLADMTGDGLQDQVRITNGRVVYYPNLGHGHFGEAVLMENSPVLDFGNTLDASRIRLYDLDGSGTNDILYLGNGEIRYWYNASGNQFVEGGTIQGLPYIDNFSSANIMDLLGTGVPCLVWSNSLNNFQQGALQYLELNHGMKAGLLTSLENGMGKEEQIEYGYTGKHFLDAKKSGNPWLTKIPSHFTVADKKIIIDHITQARFVTEYKYRDGYYNGNERSFVGFGLVEQFDTSIFESESVPHDTNYAQPTCTKTWTHSGIFGWDSKRATQYYHQDPHQPWITSQFFEQTEALDTDDFLLGYQSLAGKILRQELFATNETGVPADHPIQVKQNGYCIRKLQPQTQKNCASFFAFQTEALAITYEQNPTDPKISHHLSLAVNNYGEVEKELSLSYGRRNVAPNIPLAQTKDYVMAAVHQFISRDEPDHYQTGILFDIKEFEINHLAHGVNQIISWQASQLMFDALINAAIPFDQPLLNGGASKARLISWNRSYFWNDHFDQMLPLGQMGKLVFAHHTENVCFNTTLINQFFNGKISVPQLSDPQEGNYMLQDGYWWQSTETNYFLPASSFYHLDRAEKEPGKATQYVYDAYFLNVLQITDPLGNVTQGEIDYNQMQPYRLTDPNDNVSEVLYDALGVAIVSSFNGTMLDGNGVIQPYGNKLLNDYIRRNDEGFENILANPDLYLQGASNFTFYDLDGWKNNAQPLTSINLTRENLVFDGNGNIDASVHFQLEINYQDGFGRIIQGKRKVESGPAIHHQLDGTIELDVHGEPVLSNALSRWLVTGHKVYNNKIQPVRQFEPFFSDISTFENDEALEQYGVSIQNYYDGVGRVYQTDYPNHTFSETKFTAWEVHIFDVNDTVDRSLYKTIREIQPIGSPERMALDKALAHTNTPTVIQYDPLGREFITTCENNDGTKRTVEKTLDILGNVVAITDARGIKAFEFARDMVGRSLYEKSVDAGEKWSFHNSLDQAIHVWDGRGVHQRIFYDQLGRIISNHVDGALGLNQVTEKFIYGEDISVVQAKEKNLRGILVTHFDPAGIQEIKRACPGGIPARVERKLLDQYTQEPDWTNPAAVGLNAETYVSEFTYDSLGRPTEQKLPDDTTRKFIFNHGGGVKKVLVSTGDGILNELEVLKDVTYDAKGLREMTLLGNDVKTSYTYDQETFRMSRLLAQKQGVGARTYQDIFYTYDPEGNLVHLVDEAQQPASPNPHVLEGLNVSSHSEFEYDALYQLKVAKGRVHQALLQNDYADRSNEPGVPANWGKGTRHIAINNGAAIERYTKNYQYDISGNVKSMQHVGVSQNWTTQVWTSPTSNRSLPTLDLNGVPVTNPENRFDANGNCIYLPHLRKVEWNYRNNISKAVVIDRSAQGKPNDEEYYVYGGDGIRMRKITQRVVDVANNVVEITEKIYLQGCEMKRVTRGGVELLKRFTSQITDGTNNLAFIHSWQTDTQARETDDTSLKKIHYQLSNHLGSASMELDENGDVITYEEYFPYGGTSFMAGRNQREINLKDYRYSGKERDDFTGLYYFGYRYYVHWIGGWMSPDPIGPEDSENLYLFVHNNPVNLVDPNGLQATPDPNIPETDAVATGNYTNITETQQALLSERTVAARHTLTTELGSALTGHFGPGYLAWHSSGGHWMWITGTDPSNSSGGIGPTAITDENGVIMVVPEDEVVIEEITVYPDSSGSPDGDSSDPNSTQASEGEELNYTPNPNVANGPIQSDPVHGIPSMECNSSPCQDGGAPPIAPPSDDAGENLVYVLRIIVQEGARPTAGSVLQEARVRVGSPRPFTFGEPLYGPYNLWSNESGGGLLDAANKPGYIMEDTVLEDLAEATAKRLGYAGGRYDPRLDFRNPAFNQADFDAVWHPTSDGLAYRAGISTTPVTSNGLEPWRSPAHPNPSGTVQMSREIPRVVLGGGLMGQFAKVSGVITIMVSSEIDNPYVKGIGITAGATEFVGGSAYMLGVADLGGGYFGATGATKLMTFGSGAMRVGGGVGMIVLSGYSASVHYDQGEYGLMVGDGAGVGLGTMVLTGTASGPAVALTGTAMVANVAGDYVEKQVTPEYGRPAGIAAGTGAGLAVGGVVAGGLVTFGLVSNPVGWGILVVGGVAGLVGAIW
jgi:RHS repeat-associated protein